MAVTAERLAIHEASKALGLLKEPAQRAASAFRALEVKMRREERAIAALSDTVTIPNIVYQVLIGQAQANARALKDLLALVKVEGVTVQYVSLYMALTGTDEVTARRELNEVTPPPPKATPKRMPQRKPDPAPWITPAPVEWDIYRGAVWTEDDDGPIF